MPDWTRAMPRRTLGISGGYPRGPALLQWRVSRCLHVSDFQRLLQHVQVDQDMPQQSSAPTATQVDARCLLLLMPPTMPVASGVKAKMALQPGSVRSPAHAMAWIRRVADLATVPVRSRHIGRACNFCEIHSCAQHSLVMLGGEMRR